MFLASVDRPRELRNRAAFIELLGICPFVEMAITSKEGKNREANTKILRPPSVDANTWKYLMMETVVHALRKAAEYSKRRAVI